MEEKLVAFTVRMPESLANDANVLASLTGVRRNTVIVAWVERGKLDEMDNNKQYAAVMQAIEDGE